MHDKQQLEAANKAHFDALSDSAHTHTHAYDELTLRLSRALRRVVPLEEDTTYVLDYACGSGTVLQLVPVYSATAKTHRLMAINNQTHRTAFSCARATRCASRRRRYQPTYGRAVQRARGRTGS